MRESPEALSRMGWWISDKDCAVESHKTIQSRTSLDDESRPRYSVVYTYTIKTQISS